ncbi:hypothetical protein [Shewanella sp. MEBiC00475]|uniref:hypothetical protein n=1 Tax=Shewanella sp. MEBiC00475 TaxID=2575361 RepID=UPI0010BFC6FB|nr:hypothetical protein [Shewanella sp. MEBiC00475]
MQTAQRTNTKTLGFIVKSADIDKMLELMDGTFTDFQNSMPKKPQLVELSFGKTFRFENKTIYEAMIQKLARVQSTVRAAHLLLQNGFVQEQAALQRTIDETNEDIGFLVYAVTNDEITELHQRYLDAFWEEEVDETGNLLTSEQKRPMISRTKIQAYIARVSGADLNQHERLEVTKTISKAYSGYVHGASPHIMEMYGGNPPKFHTQGLLGTPKMMEHADDLWNYVYRSFISHVLVAKALGAENHVKCLIKHLHQFEVNAGMIG